MATLSTGGGPYITNCFRWCFFFPHCCCCSHLKAAVYDHSLIYWSLFTPGAECLGPILLIQGQGLISVTKYQQTTNKSLKNSLLYKPYAQRKLLRRAQLQPFVVYIDRLSLCFQTPVCFQGNLNYLLLIAPTSSSLASHCDFRGKFTLCFWLPSVLMSHSQLLPNN